MKRRTIVAVAASMFVGGAVSAQVVDRVWDNGSVWQITEFRVKPGQYNAFMKFVHDVSMPRIAYRRQAGDVLSYHVLQVNSPRENDPDLLVLTEYKNMGVLDRSPAYFEDMDRKFAGSLQSRQVQMSQARQLVDFKGSILAREMTFMR